jgi:hypothetical protein
MSLLQKKNPDLTPEKAPDLPAVTLSEARLP